jgi:hypothetical protein
MWNGRDWSRGHKSREEWRHSATTMVQNVSANYWNVNVSAKWTASPVSKRRSASRGGSREMYYSVSKSHELLDRELKHIVELVTILVAVERSANVILCAWNPSPQSPFIHGAQNVKTCMGELFSFSLFSKQYCSKLKKSLMTSMFFFSPSQTAFLQLEGKPNVRPQLLILKDLGLVTKKRKLKADFWIEYFGIRNRSDENQLLVSIKVFDTIYYKMDEWYIHSGALVVWA